MTAEEATPQIFLDVLDARYLSLNMFCVLIVDECHHCAGSHPFARVFSEHYGRLKVRQLRVLGMSGNLVKRKIKDDKERDKAKIKLEKAMFSKIFNPVAGRLYGQQ